MDKPVSVPFVQQTGLSIIEAILWLQLNPELAIFSSTNITKYLGFAHWNGNNLVDTGRKLDFEFDDLDIVEATWCTSQFRTYVEFYNSLNGPVVSLEQFIFEKRRGDYEPKH